MKSRLPSQTSDSGRYRASLEFLNFKDHYITPVEGNGDAEENKLTTGLFPHCVAPDALNGR